MSRREGYGFGSLARDFAADVVMGEGGDRDEVREGFSDADLDRIALEHRAEYDILADERAAESDGNEPGLPELDDLVDGPSVVRGPAR